jgi:pyrimidine deaminase RibD-like protein
MSATPEDRRWLEAAIEESRRCPPSTRAYSVGAIVVDADGVELARGYSRETDPTVHAEEAALGKLEPGLALEKATIYTSLEPCSIRRSRPQTCTRLIMASGVGRVVFGLNEPPALVAGGGAMLLREAGVEVVQIDELADDVREINHHIIGPWQLGRLSG